MLIIINPIKKSNILHEKVFCISGAMKRAPYARVKKNTKLASEAPIANAILYSPENCWEMEPIRITVSR